jgi:hypothetical protein
MRADIHDGQEHPLHQRAGYRRARPITPAQQIQLATHGRSFKKIGRQLGQPYFGWRFSIGRSTSSYVGTWVLSDHDSSAAPQTVQIASPVCGAKNFSSVRLYSAPQLHCTIVAIPGNAFRTVDFPAWNSATIEPLLTRQRFQTKNHLRKLVSRETQSEQIVFRVTPVAIRAAPLPSVSQALADPSPAPLAVCGRRPTLCAALPLKDTNHQRERAARKRPFNKSGGRV